MTLESLLQDFHFIRPWFLLLVPIAALIYYFLRQLTHSNNRINHIIDSDLLKHLLSDRELKSTQNYLPTAAAIFWLLSCLALSGPSWEKVQQPVVKNQNALVIILDLSLSMYAEDSTPSRIVTAKRKISDILELREDGLTALIVYSGDAHVVAPLTDDTETISTLLPPLEPGIMPKYGSNPSRAIELANELLQNAAINQADILIISDEISRKQFSKIAESIPTQSQLTILGVGTPEGAPIPLNEGFLKDKSNTTVIAQANLNKMRQYSNENGFIYSNMGFSNDDITHLIGMKNGLDKTLESDREIDQWEDKGHLLIIILIPLFLLFFRRGALLILPLMLFSPDNYALSWDELWLNKDQQAEKMMQQEQYKEATETFRDPEWKAAAQYKAGDYESALEGFSSDNANSLYNKGNALAKLGKLEEAITAYNEALEKNPQHKDALFNKGVIEKILEDQKQDQQSKNNQDKENNEEQEQEQQSEEQQNQDSSQQDSSDSQQNQQSDDNQDSDQQNQESSTQDTAENNQEQEDQQNTNTQNQQENEDEEANEQSSSSKDFEQEEQTEDAQENISQEKLTPLEKEQKQALEQWLRKIPDEPGQLLKNKFRYEYQKNRQENDLIDNESDKAW